MGRDLEPIHRHPANRRQQARWPVHVGVWLPGAVWVEQHGRVGRRQVEGDLSVRARRQKVILHERLQCIEPLDHVRPAIRHRGHEVRGQALHQRPRRGQLRRAHDPAMREVIPRQCIGPKQHPHRPVLGHVPVRREEVAVRPLPFHHVAQHSRSRGRQQKVPARGQPRDAPRLRRHPPQRVARRASLRMVCQVRQHHPRRRIRNLHAHRMELVGEPDACVDQRVLRELPCQLHRSFGRCEPAGQAREQELVGVAVLPRRAQRRRVAWREHGKQWAQQEAQGRVARRGETAPGELGLHAHQPPARRQRKPEQPRRDLPAQDDARLQRVELGLDQWHHVRPESRRKPPHEVLRHAGHLRKQPHPVLAAEGKPAERLPRRTPQRPENRRPRHAPERLPRRARRHVLEQRQGQQLRDLWQGPQHLRHAARAFVRQPRQPDVQRAERRRNLAAQGRVRQARLVRRRHEHPRLPQGHSCDERRAHHAGRPRRAHHRLALDVGERRDAGVAEVAGRRHGHVQAWRPLVGHRHHHVVHRIRDLAPARRPQHVLESPAQPLLHPAAHPCQRIGPHRVQRRDRLGRKGRRRHRHARRHGIRECRRHPASQGCRVPARRPEHRPREAGGIRERGLVHGRELRDHAPRESRLVGVRLAEDVHRRRRAIARTINGPAGGRGRSPRRNEPVLAGHGRQGRRGHGGRERCRLFLHAPERRREVGPRHPGNVRPVQRRPAVAHHIAQ